MSALPKLQLLEKSKINVDSLHGSSVGSTYIQSASMITRYTAIYCLRNLSNFFRWWTDS